MPLLDRSLCVLCVSFVDQKLGFFFLSDSNHWPIVCCVSVLCGRILEWRWWSTLCPSKCSNPKIYSRFFFWLLVLSLSLSLPFTNNSNYYYFHSRAFRYVSLSRYLFEISTSSNKTDPLFSILFFSQVKHQKKTGKKNSYFIFFLFRHG